MTSTKPSTISRRTLAKGAAWSVPAVAIASSAPAFAASPEKPEVWGTACQLFYGSGQINMQTHDIFLGIRTSTGVIPAGTTLSWQVCMSGSTQNQVPIPNYDANAQWTLSISHPKGTVIGNGCFTATIHFSQDYTTGAGPGGEWCGPRLQWTTLNDARLDPNTQISLTANAAGPGIAGPTTGSLVYKVAKRHPNSINTSGRSPHTFISKTGGQLCYPPVQYSRVLSSDGFDNVTCYPSGTTLTNPCSWGGTSCSGTTGTCIPRTTGPKSGQYRTPEVC